MKPEAKPKSSDDQKTAAEMVIARFATFPISFNAAIDPTSLPAYQAVADYLVKKSK